MMRQKSSFSSFLLPCEFSCTWIWTQTHRSPEFLALKHEPRILGHAFNPVCGFSMMEQVRLCAVWPIDNWLGSSLNQIPGWITVRESYSGALEQGSLGRIGRTHTARSISNMRANLANEGGALGAAKRISLLSHPHSGNFVPLQGGQTGFCTGKTKLSYMLF